METRQFRVLKGFWSAELKSGYEAGLSYTIRPGNERLAVQAAAWFAAGLIEFIAAPGSGVAGQATTIGG